MNIQKWLNQNTFLLSGKTIAVTGTTGGIGRPLCRYLAALGARLILLDRNAERSEAFRKELISQYPDTEIDCMPMDLENLDSVQAAAEFLKQQPIDVLIHNAGAYQIPRQKSKMGFENVFQINFASPYYLTRELLPKLRLRNGKVVAVGSIAHRYSLIDPTDMDFSTRKKASLVYGNAKRFLMFGLSALFEKETKAFLAIVHPGISFTNITAHYPALLFAMIKHPMKWIFMKPEKAALSILAGVFDTTKTDEWIGPAIFDIWGYPKKKHLSSLQEGEREEIALLAEQCYEKMKS